MIKSIRDLLIFIYNPVGSDDERNSNITAKHLRFTSSIPAFQQLDARLPVLLRHGGITWIIWGKRKLEGSGKFPNSS